MGVLDFPFLRKIGAQAEYNGRINPLDRAMNRGVNLFNKADVIPGKYLANDGTIKSHSSYTLTYIPVDINIGSRISVKAGTECAQCDENKNIIAGTQFSGSGATRTQTLLTETRYLLVSTLVSSLDSQTVIYGEDVVNSVPFDGAMSVNTKVVGGNVAVTGDVYTNNFDYAEYDRNILDNTRWIIGKALNTDGTVINSSSSAITDWIPVNPKVWPSLNFKMRNGTSLNVTIYRVTLYKKDYSFISQTDSISFNTPTINLTPETAYVRFWIQNRNTTYGFEGVLKYGCFPIDYFDLKPYSGGMPGNLITPDDLIPMYRFGGTKDSPTFVASSDAGAMVTTYIPVKPNTRYFVQSSQEVSNGNSRQARFYGRGKELVGVLNDGTYTGNDCVIETPYNAYFMVFSFMDSQWDKMDRTHFIGLVETDKWDGKVGHTLADDGKVRLAETSGPFPMGRNKILGIYDNYIALLNFDKTKILYSANGWNPKSYNDWRLGSLKTGGWKEYPINSTTFPGYTNETINQIVFFRTKKSSTVDGIACLVFATNNKIWYCSDCLDAGALTFAVPNIWDVLGEKSWRIDGTASGNYKTDSKGNTRYKKYYPSDIASRLGQWDWHNGPLWLDGIGGQYSRGILFGNYTDGEDEDPAPSCLYFTETGEDIYIQYEFGVVPKRYKVAGDATVKTRTTSISKYAIGDDVDFSDATLFPSGSAFTALSIKKRYSIVPSSAEKDPTAIFEYDANGLSVSSVSGKNITMQSVDGLAVGDVIIFEGTATGGYANLLTTSIDSTTKVGNGPVFFIKTISGNVITIADAIGNPKNNLFCRHIHGVAEFGQGVCIYTGEEYPQSWFIYLNPYLEDIGDGTNANNAQWKDDVVRLNSSENAYQRALGVILRPDGKVVYIADSNNPQTAKLSIRGKDIKMGNYGLVVFDLADIDDNSTALTKIEGVNAGYALYRLGDILLYSDYYGKTYYSEDWGDNWKYLCEDNYTKSKVVGFDAKRTRFYFNLERGEQSIVEINPKRP